MSRLAFFALFMIALASCTTNKDLLISSQSRELQTLEGKVRLLERERAAQERAIQELNEQLEACQEDNRLGEAFPHSGASSAASELSTLKAQSRAGLQSFLNGGIEREFNATMAQLDAAIEHARGFMGTPHKQGDMSRQGIDCSGLVHVALSHVGLEDLPRTANDFARYGTVIVNPDHLRRGDLVFFTKTYPSSRFITHIGMYLGGNEFIHTSSSKGVMTSTLMDGSYWQNHYVFGTRISR